MSIELQALEDAVGLFQSEADLGFVDPKRLATVVDRLQATLCEVLYRGKKRGDHLLSGRTPTGWAIQTCASSPGIAEAVTSGGLGYQSAAVICNFRGRLREDLRPLVEEEWWLGQAKEISVRSLSWLEQHVRYMIDPDSFDHQVEEDYEKRFLSISESGGMFHISGVLDREAGTALEAAIQSLSRP